MKKQVRSFALIAGMRLESPQTVLENVTVPSARPTAKVLESSVKRSQTVPCHCCLSRLFFFFLVALLPIEAGIFFFFFRVNASADWSVPLSYTITSVISDVPLSCAHHALTKIAAHVKAPAYRFE